MDLKIIPEGYSDSDYPTNVDSLGKFYISNRSVAQSNSFLSQYVIRSLMTKKGSVITDLDRGSNVASMAGTLNVMDTADASVMIQQDIKDLQDQVIKMQRKSSKYLPSERLRSLAIRSIRTGDSSIYIELKIINELNQVNLLEVRV